MTHSKRTSLAALIRDRQVQARTYSSLQIRKQDTNRKESECGRFGKYKRNYKTAYIVFMHLSKEICGAATTHMWHMNNSMNSSLNSSVAFRRTS